MSSASYGPAAADYNVGWMCAITTEFVAAQALIDEEYQTPSHPVDENAYFCGRIGQHNVVIACLPIGRYGISSAAVLATHMTRSFPNLTIKLMVGIGGGAPSSKNDIRLGDVVVSKPVGQTGGVIHHQFGKIIQNQPFTNTGRLNSPTPTLLNAAGHLYGRHRTHGHRINETVDVMLAKYPRLIKDFAKPQIDTLYQSTFLHPAKSSDDCRQTCDARYAIRRAPRPEYRDQPVIHYGLIASSDTLLKDALVRDQLAEREGVMCIEMEAAGLMDTFQCLVIRGICDYADTHKNDAWQGYAAAVAAAYAKELLQVIPARASQGTLEVPSSSTLMSSSPSLRPSTPSLRPSTPIRPSEFDKDCKYCSNWRSWEHQLGCPMHCSQCKVTAPPTNFQKLRAGFERSQYWSKDKLCPPHIRQREAKEDELRAKAAQQAAIEAQQQAQIQSSVQPQSWQMFQYQQPQQSCQPQCRPPPPQSQCRPQPQMQSRQFGNLKFTYSSK